MGVHQLRPWWAADRRRLGRRRRRPVALEHLEVPAERSVVRVSIHGLEELGCAGQYRLILREPRVFRERIERKRLAVDHLGGVGDTRGRLVDLPEVPAVLRVAHTIDQEAVAVRGGLSHFRCAMAGTSQT
jgi:hypothetical protein